MAEERSVTIAAPPAGLMVSARASRGVATSGLDGWWEAGRGRGGGGLIWCGLTPARVNERAAVVVRARARGMVAVTAGVWGAHAAWTQIEGSVRDADGLVVGKFPRAPDGGAMAVELTGAVSSGDVLVAVNGARLRGLPPAEQRGLLMDAPWPRTLTFKRAAGGGRQAAEAAPLSLVGSGSTAAAAGSAASLGVVGGGAGSVVGSGGGVSGAGLRVAEERSVTIAAPPAGLMVSARASRGVATG